MKLRWNIETTIHSWVKCAWLVKPHSSGDQIFGQRYLSLSTVPLHSFNYTQTSLRGISRNDFPLVLLDTRQLVCMIYNPQVNTDHVPSKYFGLTTIQFYTQMLRVYILNAVNRCFIYYILVL
jgi:hypothetical protein